jgi:hypothetical protein
MNALVCYEHAGWGGCGSFNCGRAAVDDGTAPHREHIIKYDAGDGCPYSVKDIGPDLSTVIR